MNKKNSLKNNMMGGLDALIRQTTFPSEDAGKSPQQKKNKIIRCNFLIEASYHKQLKMLAAQHGISMVQALKEALDLYFKTKDTKQ